MSNWMAFSDQGVARISRGLLAGLSAVLVTSFGGCPAPESDLAAQGLPPGAESGPSEGISEETMAERVVDFRVTPGSGPVEGGTVVTIVGRGFTTDTSVEFGASSAVEVTVVNDQLLTAIAPPADPGAVDLVLRFPAGEFPARRAPLRIPRAFQYYVMPPDDGADSDGDGLSDFVELRGWEIWVDAFGLGLGEDTFGNVARYTVLSDPAKVDTDGDGLTDLEESHNKCDARNDDTDGDGLTDYEEVVRWRTSPTSIDTDGDARGETDARQAPQPALFDGNELKTIGFEPPSDELIIAEYVEGSAGNRALEIYNPSDAAIDMSAEGYSIAILGAPTGQGPTIVLSGPIPARGTFVVADPGASADILARTNQIVALPFDGSQAIALRRAGQTVDVLGSTLFSYGDPMTDASQGFSGSVAPGTQWQDFVVENSGRLSTITIQVMSFGQPESIGSIRILRAGNEIDSRAFVIHGNTFRNYHIACDAFVSADETLRLEVNVGAALVIYAPADAYPRGACSLGVNADLLFVTEVRRVAAQEFGELSLRDQTLRRNPRSARPLANLTNPASLAAFSTYPTDAFDGLGSHRAVRVPRRIIAGGTSPALADTDGDGASDYAERDTPVRRPLVAELPEIRFELAAPVSVRLRAEYSDAIGSEVAYGIELSNATTTETSRTDIESTTRAWSVGGSVGFEGKTATGSVSGSYGEERTEGTELTTSTASESAAAYSQQLTASRERTLSVSRGSVALGIRAVNSGTIAYTLDGLSIAVRQFVPRLGEYRSLTTLLPPSGATSYTLAPGNATTVITMRDDDVDPGLVREFLANPSSVFLEPSTYELLDAGGTNFVFTTEHTFGRTALVSVDFGDGNVIQRRVATNVDRLENGEFAGVSMKAILAELDLDYQVAAMPGEPRRLISVNGVSEEPFGGAPPALGDPAYPAGLAPDSRDLRAYWYLVSARGDSSLPPVDLRASFDEFVVKARDEVRLAYVRDEDRDGLNDRQEFTIGSSDADTDSDNDLLSDWFEARVGWQIIVSGQNAPAPYTVFANATLVDADGDGWSDRQEYERRTDPNNPDTDDDTLTDASDPLPLRASRTLFVNAASVGGDGSSWDAATPSLATALNTAIAAYNTPDPADDVQQIWVAQGVYTATTPFPLPARVSAFGGFAGNETRRNQRDPDPASNGTRLSGLNTGVRIMEATAFDARLDGFTFESADNGFSGAALWVGGGSDLVFANLMFIGNRSSAAGGALYHLGGIGSGAIYENITFGNNSAADRGGAVQLINATARFVRCDFQGNAVSVGAGIPVGGGGAVSSFGFGGHSEFENCTFRDNLVRCSAPAAQVNYYRAGGAVLLDSIGRSKFSGCSFRRNEVDATNSGLWEADQRAGGGLAISASGDHSLVNCAFSANRSAKTGGGIWVRDPEASNPSTRMAVRLTNCSIADNETYLVGSQYGSGAGIMVSVPYGPAVTLNNCIVWGNRAIGGSDANTELEQLGSVGGGYIAASCCVQNLDTGFSALVGGSGNIGDDPLFRGAPRGDLRLSAGSPCIDTGNRNVDVDLSAPGSQPLPAFDFRGDPRIVDGDGDEFKDIDIGAIEFQGD